MKIGKYEFASEQEALQVIDNLGFDINEDGNKYPNHNNAIVHLGFLVTPPKYSVDVLWENEEHPLFKKYYVEVVGQGSHVFAGLDYQQYKVR